MYVGVAVKDRSSDVDVFYNNVSKMSIALVGESPKQAPVINIQGLMSPSRPQSDLVRIPESAVHQPVSLRQQQQRVTGEKLQQVSPPARWETGAVTAEAFPRDQVDNLTTPRNSGAVIRTRISPPQLDVNSHKDAISISPMRSKTAVTTNGVMSQSPSSQHRGPGSLVGVSIPVQHSQPTSAVQAVTFKPTKVGQSTGEKTSFSVIASYLLKYWGHVCGGN